MLACVPKTLLQDSLRLPQSKLGKKHCNWDNEGKILFTELGIEDSSQDYGITPGCLVLALIEPSDHDIYQIFYTGVGGGLHLKLLQIGY